MHLSNIGHGIFPEKTRISELWWFPKKWGFFQQINKRPVNWCASTHIWRHPNNLLVNFRHFLTRHTMHIKAQYIKAFGFGFPRLAVNAILTKLLIPVLSSIVVRCVYIMTSSNETISTLLDLREGNPPVTAGFPHKGPLRGALPFSVISAWTNGWANNRDAGDLGCHCTHYDAIVMSCIDAIAQVAQYLKYNWLL